MWFGIQTEITINVSQFCSHLNVALLAGLELQIIVRTAKMEDPDQTDSSEAV